jgi:hypothetical protein
MCPHPPFVLSTQVDRGRRPPHAIIRCFFSLDGHRKIPEVAKGLGEGIRNFKTALKGEEKAEEKKQA